MSPVLRPVEHYFDSDEQSDEDDLVEARPRFGEGVRRIAADVRELDREAHLRAVRASYDRFWQ